MLQKYKLTFLKTALLTAKNQQRCFDISTDDILKINWSSEDMLWKPFLKCKYLNEIWHGGSM